MKKAGISLTSVGLWVLFGVAVVADSSAAENRRERRFGHVLYELNPSASPEQKAALNRILSRHHLSQRKAWHFGGGVSLAGRVDQTSGLSGALVANTATTEEEIATQLSATGAVRYAEADYRVYPVDMGITQQFNDPGIAKQWHHEKIHSPQAWDITSGSNAIRVTVCDSGVDSTHPDLKNRLILPGFNTVDGTKNTAPVNPHGTMVSGLIAAQAGNAIGIAGVAPNVRILPVRVSNLSNGSAYLSDLAECIQYGADHGAKIHNVSYTGANSPTINSAAVYARKKGTLLFMAAGNAGQDISNYPMYTSFLRVGSTTQTDARSSFSNYGKVIDIVAPGSSVYTTSPQGKYSIVSGTSFASPISAAVGALILSVNPAFTPDDVQGILFESADNIGNSYYYGHGRVNAEAAVDLARKWVVK